MKRLVNCSIDTLDLRTDQHYSLPRYQLEYDFARLIASQTIIPIDIYVINGPWSFTNLRIGTLSINLHKMLHPTIRLWSCTKIDLCNAWTQAWWPQEFLLRIGQRHNRWHMTGSHIDTVRVEPSLLEYPVDSVSLWPYDTRVVWRDEWVVGISWRWQTYVLDIPRQTCDSLTPWYMMDPNIW